MGPCVFFLQMIIMNSTKLGIGGLLDSPQSVKILSGYSAQQIPGHPYDWANWVKERAEGRGFWAQLSEGYCQSCV